MPYIFLGPRTVTATLDQTGLNAGNYTCSFTPAVFNTNMPYFELHHALVTNVPLGAAATVNWNNKPYSYTYPNLGSEWDPAQPLLLNPADQVDFLWNIVASGPAPIVTVYLRYEASNLANIQAGG